MPRIRRQQLPDDGVADSDGWHSGGVHGDGGVRGGGCSCGFCFLRGETVVDCWQGQFGHRFVTFYTVVETRVSTGGSVEFCTSAKYSFLSMLILAYLCLYISIFEMLFSTLLS